MVCVVVVVGFYFIVHSLLLVKSSGNIIVFISFPFSTVTIFEAFF